MTSAEALITILAVAAATLATRAFAFLLFPPGRPTPPYISYLGRVLPVATIGLLIVYCVKTATPLAYPHGLPELIAIVLTGLIQWFAKNTLAAIVAGTIVYMLLVQSVFT
ncbi:MAG: AzlD domain-containing protein [Candidatus Adiutrix sp.]|jgi:branched-subunit amino acid transport protein AzlD|nr:AzlD domain-containing protein [Candidatus Adiutrix sp.]